MIQVFEAYKTFLSTLFFIIELKHAVYLYMLMFDVFSASKLPLNVQKLEILMVSLLLEEALL